MRFPRYVFWIIVAALIVIAVGLGYKHFYHPSATRQAVLSASDDAITSAIQAKLFENPTLKQRTIQVSSKGGVVTLAGSVESDIEKLAVEGIASGTAGVHQVIDDLSVVASQEAAATEMSPHQGVAHLAAQPRLLAMRRAPAERSEVAGTERAQRQNIRAQATSQHAGARAPGSLPAATMPKPAPALRSAAAVPPKPVAPPPVVVPNGYQVHVRLTGAIDSKTAQPGETYAACFAVPAVINAKLVFPVGTECRVRLAEIHQGGRFSGATTIEIELASITYRGVKYPATSGYYNVRASARGRSTAEATGGGAGLGALIWAIAGRGKGAAIGAGAGATAGGIVQALRKPRLRVPSETVIDFTLSSPIVVKQQTAQP